MPCVVCREVVVGAVCTTVHATDNYLWWASSHCARTPATANGDLAQLPDPTLAQPKLAQVPPLQMQTSGFAHKTSLREDNQEMNQKEKVMKEKVKGEQREKSGMHKCNRDDKKKRQVLCTKYVVHSQKKSGTMDVNGKGVENAEMVWCKLTGENGGSNDNVSRDLTMDCVMCHGEPKSPT